MEVNANTVEGGTDGAKEGGGDITEALVVSTPALSKGASMVDKGATKEPTETASALTSVVAVTS